MKNCNCMRLTNEAKEILLQGDDQLPCPPGFVPDYPLPLRHAIDLSLLPPAILAKDINVSFAKEFNLPLWNEKKKRISFLTQKGLCRRLIKWSEVRSRDPRIHEFNKKFLESNPHLQEYYNSLRTYDFKEDEGGLDLMKRDIIDGLKSVSKDFKENPVSYLFPTWLKITLGIVIIGGVVYYMPKKTSNE